MEAADRRGHSQLCAKVSQHFPVLRYQYAQQSAEGAALRVEAQLAIHIRQESHHAAGPRPYRGRRNRGRPTSAVRPAARTVWSAVHRQNEGGGAGMGARLRGAGVCAQRLCRHRNGGAA